MFSSPEALLGLFHLHNVNKMLFHQRKLKFLKRVLREKKKLTILLRSAEIEKENNSVSGNHNYLGRHPMELSQLLTMPLDFVFPNCKVIPFVLTLTFWVCI